MASGGQFAVSPDTQDPVVAAARLEYDPGALLRARAGEASRRGRVVGDPMGSAKGMMNVEPILGVASSDEV